MKIKCIALDLDRTTLHSAGYLSEKNKDAIIRAMEHGIEVVAASGRALDSLPEEILGLSDIRYAVTSNGVAVHDLRSGTCLRSYKLTAESVHRIMDLTRDEGTAYETFIGGKAYAMKEYVEDPVKYGALPPAIPYIRRTRMPVDDIHAFIRLHEDELDCIDLVCSSEKKKHEIWERLVREVPDIYVTSSVPQLLEISYKDAGKHEGVRFLLKHLGISEQELAAFGDGANDREMLEMAGIGVAVANAAEECKAAADWVVSCNDEDGVAEGIERILNAK